MSKTLPFANLKVPVPGFGSVRVQHSTSQCTTALLEALQ